VDGKNFFKYNPAFLSERDLLRSFVVRQTEFETVLGVVRENADDANQHVLVSGPRGSGKTTLSQRLRVELQRDPALRQLWYPIVFAEESYQVTSPGEFWLEAVFHLDAGAASPDSRWRKAYEDIGKDWQNEDRMRERALGTLLDFADQQDKRLILFVENLDMLLGGQLSRDEAWVLRHTLQTEKRIMLFATATARFDLLNGPEHAMYELFRPVPLLPLDADQCRLFWQDRTGDLLEDQRIRPIEILTGGNLRLLSILAGFADVVSLRHLMGNLVRLVDEHTEYFKSYLDGLPAVERKVFLALADRWEPSTAKEVAAAGRLDVNKASSLLRRLSQRGAVTVIDLGKRTKQYQVTERMYNIYYLLRRRGGASQRVQAIVRFIMDFYDPEQVRPEDRAGRLEKSVAHLGHYLQDVDLVRENLEPAINLAVDLTAGGFGRQALEAIIESPSASNLEPLITGLSMFLNQEKSAPTEVLEVGKDIVARIEERRSRAPTAKH
jgi:hypothetical protein